jgi:hypothetical protein
MAKTFILENHKKDFKSLLHTLPGSQKIYIYLFIYVRGNVLFQT